MTKQEYAEIRDYYAELVRRLNNCEDDWNNDHYPRDDEGESDYEYLERSGHWLTYEDLKGLRVARELFEKISGRAASRCLDL